MESFKDPSSLFISFEGIEGSGKTTQIKRISHYLTSKGYTVTCLREPGGTTFGEGLREVILKSQEPIAPISEALLFASSRAQLLSEIILPKLKQKKHAVILDRYVDSSFAYQGVARGLGIETIKNIHSHYPLNIFPDITLYLKIDLETSLKRQNTRGNEKDYFEKEKESFYTLLIEGFDKCHDQFSERIKLIDASVDMDSVTQEIKETIKGLLSNG